MNMRCIAIGIAVLLSYILSQENNFGKKQRILFSELISFFLLNLLVISRISFMIKLKIMGGIMKLDKKISWNRVSCGHWPVQNIKISPCHALCLRLSSWEQERGLSDRVHLILFWFIRMSLLTSETFVLSPFGLEQSPMARGPFDSYSLLGSHSWPTRFLFYLGGGWWMVGGGLFCL